MSKLNGQRPPKDKKRRFAAVYNDVAQGDAWESLSPLATAMFVEILLRHNGFNNGAVPYGCRDAAKRFRVSKNTAARAFKELQCANFIEQSLKGWFGDKYRRASEWTIVHIQKGNSREQTHQKSRPKAAKDESKGVIGDEPYLRTGRARHHG